MGVNAKNIIKKSERFSEARETFSNIPAGDELRLWIAEAAYYKAEQRGFEPGFEDHDWLVAETEIMRGSII